MSVDIPVGAAADQRSWKRVADNATRTFGNAGKDAGREFANALSGSSKDVEQALKRMGDKASDAYDKAADAVGKLKSEEAQLKKARDSGDDSRIIRQAERVETARRSEARAVRDATRAYREYQDAADDAGRRNNTNVIGGMRAQAGQSAQLGREMADGFSGGFVNGVSGAASIARLGAAGGPIGIALMGLTAVGVLVGSRVAGAIADGMATTATKDLFQSRMGLDERSIGQFATAAGHAYANNFGSSMADNLGAAQAALRAGLITPSADDTEVQRTVEQLQGAGQVTEATAAQLSRSAATLIRTGFANSTSDALDIITAGFQKGLDVSGDWLDTINEYSTQFRKLGLDGSQVLTLLKQGFEGGARDTDKVADSLKEFSIRAVDGSKTTKEGFEALGFSAEEMGKRFSAGGEQARQAFGAVLTGLRNLDDPVQQALVWQRLFGTQWEDMGDAVNKLDLDPAKNQFTDLQDTSKRATETATANFKSEWEGATKTVGQWFDNLKTSLSDWFVDLPGIRSIPGLIKDIFSDPVTSYGPPNPNARPNPARLDPSGALVPAGSGATVPPGNGTGFLTNLLSPGNGVPIPADSPLAPKPNNATDGGPQAGDRKAIAPTPADTDKTKPAIDPKLWSVDANPVAIPPGMSMATSAPGVPPASAKGPGYYDVDPMRVYDAESSVQRAKNSLEQDRIALIRLEQEGNADADALLRAKNQVADAERSFVSSQMKLAEAQQGTWKKMEGSAKSLSDGMEQIGAALDKDFGLSKGLPGLAENLTKFLANMAAAPLLGQLGAVAQANPSKGGYGAMGVLAAQGVFGPQYTGVAPSAGSAGGGYPVRGGNAPYPGDAALMSNVKAGKYVSEPGVGDLTQGIGDCTSAVEDLVDIMDGRPTAGRSLSTGNAAEWLPQHGFVPGVGGAGDFRVGFNPSHMQATLPGGTNINWGSDAAAAQRGMDGGQGADDPALTSRYYRPAGGGYSPVAPSVGVGTTPVAPSYQDLADPANPGLSDPVLSGGGGWGGGTGPAQGWSPSQPGTRIGGVTPASGSGAGGVGIAPGGTIDTAIGMAASVGDMFAPGAGQAASTGIKLANRAIQFAGQGVGIGAQGAIDALLPTGGSELANKSWVTKILGGVAGAAPAIPNVAGKQSAPPNPNQNDPNAQGGGQGQGGDTNINVTNNRATEDGTGRDIAYHQQQQHQAPGM
ncbi:phage tail tape measure protein [Mycobacteriaceae bacterium NPDC060252]